MATVTLQRRWQPILTHVYNCLASVTWLTLALLPIRAAGTVELCVGFATQASQIASTWHCHRLVPQCTCCTTLWYLGTTGTHQVEDTNQHHVGTSSRRSMQLPSKHRPYTALAESAGKNARDRRDGAGMLLTCYVPKKLGYQVSPARSSLGPPLADNLPNIARTHIIIGKAPD